MRYCRSNPKPIPHELTHLWWERFLSFFEMRGDDCWEWNGALVNGYGHFSFADEAYLAHRISYEVYKGILAPGLEPDHTCRNRKCVNPSNLEAVSYAENQRRARAWKQKAAPRQYCRNGHALAGDNVTTNNGSMVCRVCFNAGRRARYHARKDELAHADKMGIA